MEQGEEAGHADWVEVTAEPISQSRVTGFVTASTAGAISLFLGEIREAACQSLWYIQPYMSCVIA